MIISISGMAGSGKSTVAQLLADKLNFKRYYVGGLRRAKAAERGMTINEYNKLGQTDPTTDTEVDYYAKELGQKEDNFIIEGRTMWYFIPHSIKVYITVGKNEAARRIMQDIKINPKTRNEDTYESIEDAIKKLQAREDSDNLRYQKYYQIDCSSMDNYDLIIDTTVIPPEQVVQRIINYLDNLSDK